MPGAKTGVIGLSRLTQISRWPQTIVRQARAQQTYDVTESLVTGGNCLGALVAEGWQSGPVGTERAGSHFGERVEFLAQLEFVYADCLTCIIHERSNPALEGPGYRSKDYPVRGKRHSRYSVLAC